MAVKKEPGFTNPPDSAIREILKECRTVAVVGLSDDPGRPSHSVAKFLKGRGYRIVPVNPKLETVLGEKCYASLTDIPFKVDIVDVFRKPEHVPLIADVAARIGAKVLWLQLGVIAPEAAKKHSNFMTVVMDRCMAIEYRRLLE